MADLQFDWIGFDQKKLSVCSKCVKYKLVQLETSCTVILHPKVIIAASQIIERLNKS